MRLASSQSCSLLSSILYLAGEAGQQPVLPPPVPLSSTWQVRLTSSQSCSLLFSILYLAGEAGQQPVLLPPVPILYLAGEAGQQPVLPPPVPISSTWQVRLASSQ